jgi:opacity protein-like surface antigen
MKKLLVVLFALTICITASAEGMYFGIDAGYGLWTIEPKDATAEWKPMNASVAFNVGKSFDGLRLEGSLGMTLASDDKEAGATLEYSNYNLMFNIYYDLMLSNALYIYPTIGVGIVRSTMDWGGSMDKNALTLAMQWGLGVRYQIDSRQSIDFTIRYFGDGGPDYEYSGGDWEIEAEAIHASLGYKLWF